MDHKQAQNSIIDRTKNAQPQNLVMAVAAALRRSEFRRQPFCRVLVTVLNSKKNHCTHKFHLPETAAATRLY